MREEKKVEYLIQVWERQYKRWDEVASRDSEEEGVKSLANYRKRNSNFGFRLIEQTVITRVEERVVE